VINIGKTTVLQNDPTDKVNYLGAIAGAFPDTPPEVIDQALQ
jgi:hypothetical protein